MSDVNEQRRYYEHMMDEIATEHRQQIDQLKDENAKLRELAWRLLEVERIGATSSDWREIREQARELGVEV